MQSKQQTEKEMQAVERICLSLILLPGKPLLGRLLRGDSARSSDPDLAQAAMDLNPSGDHPPNSTFSSSACFLFRP